MPRLKSLLPISTYHICQPGPCSHCWGTCIAGLISPREGFRAKCRAGVSYRHSLRCALFHVVTKVTRFMTIMRMNTRHAALRDSSPYQAEKSPNPPDFCFFFSAPNSMGVAVVVVGVAGEGVCGRLAAPVPKICALLASAGVVACTSPSAQHAHSVFKNAQKMHKENT